MILCLCRDSEYIFLSCLLRVCCDRLTEFSYPGVGKVLPGARIRICVPGIREVVKRNVPGELHMGGTSVIPGYLGGADPEAFYTDEFGSWLKTGDQANMDEHGVVQILGRYKDLIIRGGENIAPAKIEECLGQIPGLMVSLHGWVVGSN